jgi:DNA-directed RNA polymerase sigma subunit (sigma70/sigma32)
MAAQRDLLSRLADAGEEAIQRLSKAPGGENITKALNVSRERLDELQKRVRGIEALEKRVAALEKRVDALAPQARPGKKAAAKKPAAKKPAARKPRAATSPAPNPGP